MGSALGGHLYQERRRLSFVATLAFLAGVLFYLNAPIYLGGVHISFVTGTVYAVIVWFAALLVCILLPGMRFMIEAVAIARLLLSIFVLFAPQIGFQILASPVLTALLVVAGGTLISRLIHGRILRQGPRWRAPRSTERLPARIKGTALQHRVVGWFDDRAAVPA